jgi:hypothetical protein
MGQKDDFYHKKSQNKTLPGYDRDKTKNKHYEQTLFLKS